jgi:hypothetical protein
MEPIHHADCYTEIKRMDGKAYHIIVWTCVDECPLNYEVE